MAKLLVADDLVPIRQMVRITLSTQGWTIVEAKNGNEALELVRSEKPDLVLLDVDMGPGPNGFDVCRQIKADEATKDIPVVMLTAHGSERICPVRRKPHLAAQADRVGARPEELATVVEAADTGAGDDWQFNSRIA